MTFSMSSGGVHNDFFSLILLIEYKVVYHRILSGMKSVKTDKIDDLIRDRLTDRQQCVVRASPNTDLCGSHLYL